MVRDFQASLGLCTVCGGSDPDCDYCRSRSTRGVADPSRLAHASDIRISDPDPASQKNPPPPFNAAEEMEGYDEFLAKDLINPDGSPKKVGEE